MYLQIIYSDILNEDFSINKKNIKENVWKLIA